MELEEIQRCIREGNYYFSAHADVERQADALDIEQIEVAILSGRLLEDYPDTGRGPSCLVAGLAGEVPIHAVCGWRGSALVLITVYVPGPPKFADPWTKVRTDDKDDKDV